MKFWKIWKVLWAFVDGKIDHIPKGTLEK